MRLIFKGVAIPLVLALFAWGLRPWRGRRPQRGLAVRSQVPQMLLPPDSAAAKSGQLGTQALAPAGDTRKLTEKQKVLANQAERLVEMANELKAQVDLTNKNILSLKVVEKAQAIEALAKGMKEQAKKGQ